MKLNFKYCKIDYFSIKSIFTEFLDLLIKKLILELDCHDIN